MSQNTVRTLTRGDLASFIPDHRSIMAFEDMLAKYRTANEETHFNVENATGSTITRGTVVGFAGSNSYIKGKPFLADGSEPGLYVIGVAGDDIPNATVGIVYSFGYVNEIDTTGTPYGETWASGDILYASPTTAGVLTNVKPTAPDVVIPVAAVTDVSASNGAIVIRPTLELQLYYGAFYKTSTQTPAAINTAYAITFDSSDISNGMSIGTPASRIVAANSGFYSLSSIYQFSSTSSSVKNVWIWNRKNGVDISNSAMKVSLESANALSTPTRTTMISLDAGDYIELMFASDSTSVALTPITSTAFSPAAPAVRLVVEQIQQ